MGLPLIEEMLTGNSKPVRDIVNNQAVLVGFLNLVKQIDDLPDTRTRFYEESKSLYRATSSGRTVDELVEILAAFFGQPAKAPGKSLAVTLRFDPTVKHLGGIRKDQALFLKKLKTGSFYGALWPWQRDPKKIEILLGFCSSDLRNEDYNQLETLVQKFLSQKKLGNISGVGGQIHGISLPSFLQMSEMEGATYTLKVSSANRTGYLYLDGGSLVAARYEDQTGNAAAYRIISWDNVAIQIEAADPDREREIHDPLMHVMMESLKIKDESGAETQPAVPAKSPSTPEAKKASPPIQPPAPAKQEQAPAKPASKAEPPLENEPLAHAAAAPSAPPVPVHGPFEKAVDRSVGRQDRMPWTGKLLIALVVTIIMAVAVTFGGKLLKAREVNNRYNQLIADLAVTEALDAQIVLLMQYLKANPRDVHRQELETRLQDANLAIEKQDYERTILDVNGLKIDDKYEPKALSLYTAFLKKYPESQYAEQIDEAIGGIRQLLGKAHFQDLKKVAATSYIQRYDAYRAYLEQFPQSPERKTVERMIADLADEYYRAIEKQSVTCDAQQNWDDCLDQCDRFLATFSTAAAMQSVKQLRLVLQDKKDVAGLTAKAVLTGGDYAQAKKVYTDYLKQRPDTTQKETIAQRIDAVNADLARLAAWEKTAAFATASANDIFDRIQRLEVYLEEHATGPYAAQAQKLRAQLEPQLQQAIRAKRVEEDRRQAVAQQQAEQARRAKEARRIQNLRDRVSRQLQAAATRFVDRGDGTVTDRVTGLSWCLLDSYLEIGNCISYNSANKYVQGLNTGGHSDWRLPTAGELAALYKNRPFFPGSGAEWYWTSESFARGFHRVVDVVTSARETVFTRISKNEDSCGAVRAVRG